MGGQVHSIGGGGGATHRWGRKPPSERQVLAWSDAPAPVRRTGARLTYETGGGGRCQRRRGRPPGAARPPTHRKEPAMFGLPSASYPWYTWWAFVIVSLFVLGIYLAVLLGIIKGVIEVVRAAWRGVNLACQYVFGLPLSSGGTAHWASSREVR